jgi:hypothetical protein
MVLGSGVPELVEGNWLIAVWTHRADTKAEHEGVTAIAELGSEQPGPTIRALIDGDSFVGSGGRQNRRRQLRRLMNSTPLGLPAGVAAGGARPADGQRAARHLAATRYGTVTRKHRSLGGDVVGNAAGNLGDTEATSTLRYLPPSTCQHSFHTRIVMHVVAPRLISIIAAQMNRYGCGYFAACLTIEASPGRVSIFGSASPRDISRSR